MNYIPSITAISVSENNNFFTQHMFYQTDFFWCLCKLCRRTQDSRKSADGELTNQITFQQDGKK